jgi:hypothetical protein
VADDLPTLLVQLVQEPGNRELRRRAAEALDQQGQLEQALGLLVPFVNFTGHEEGSPLPCLCKTCAASAGLTARTSGASFHRAFAIAGHRVLHFWLIDDLAEQRQEIRRSVGEGLRARLERK